MLRFTLEVRELPAGAVNDEVENVQQYLSRYGYLSGRFEPWRIDDSTQETLRAFQAFAGILETGQLDPATADAIERPRWGLSDVPAPRAISSLPPAFVPRGCDYEADFRTLTYAFVPGTADLSGTDEKKAIEEARLSTCLGASCASNSMTTGYIGADRSVQEIIRTVVSVSPRHAERPGSRINGAEPLARPPEDYGPRSLGVLTYDKAGAEVLA